MFTSDAMAKLKSQRGCSSAAFPSMQRQGKVKKVLGETLEVNMPGAPLGARVQVETSSGSEIEGEVVGFNGDHAVVAPLSSPAGVCGNALVTIIDREPTIKVGMHLVGRVLDGYLRPMDGKGPVEEKSAAEWSLVREPLNPMLRRTISKPLDLGVKAMNSMLTFGQGQRIGIMAGSGVGKSVLLGMITKYADVDINVIALIGERGREVREFIENCLGEEGLKRSIVIVSTGDQAPLAQIRAAQTATAIGEYFREQGKHVMLMMDSLTRVAHAQRVIGLSAGEAPSTKAYPPSVFALLPKLLERAGNSGSEGSLSGIYTVLVDGDDFDEPICDAARSILDGHINLKRELATKNHFPAIDVLTSASRVMVDVVPKEHLQIAGMLRELMATYARNEDAIAVGAYEQGANPKIDQAIMMLPKIEAFLRQDRSDSVNFEQSIKELYALMNGDE